MPVRHLISLKNVGPETLAFLVDRSIHFGQEAASSGHLLAGKIVGIYFRRPSTRTRSSFTVGALKPGAAAMC